LTCHDASVTTSSRLSVAVRAARARRQWTREQLANESGLSFAAITQIETGRRTEIRVSSLVALAEALDVSVDYLVRDEVAQPMLQHRAYLYDSPEQFVDVALSVVWTGLDAGHAVLVVTTEPNLSAVRQATRGNGQRVQFGTPSDWYATPGVPLGRFRDFARDARTAGADWVDILAEPPPAWSTSGRTETRAWARGESLLNVVLEPWPVSVGCFYDATRMPRRVRADVERTHPEIVTASNGAVSPSYELPENFLVR
jgi:transcriptional regulator with XRE-family HTH domain